MNFRDFLVHIDRSEVDPSNWPSLPVDPEVLASNIYEDESESVTRFKSLQNATLSLTSLCILTVSSWINEITCNAASNKEVLDLFNNHIKALPRDIQHKIATQLSMTSLRCVHQHRVWDLDPHIIAAGIKQEEDMLRYLYWKQPNNSLLTHFERTLVLDLFDDKKLSNIINNTKLRPTTQMKQALVQEFRNDCFDFSHVASKKEFKYNFKKFTHGILRHINWKNVLVVGGSVLKSLRKDQRQNAELTKQDDAEHPSDIDIYLYGLTPEQAQSKVEKIFNSIQFCWREKIGILKTANTITLLADNKFRKVQIILSTYASPLEILLASDMNSCSIGFNGDTVLVIPRFVFGALYGSNFLDSSTKFGTKLRWGRITKYYKRGYNIIAPLYLRVHGNGSLDISEKINPQVHPTTHQLIELMCLMKVLLNRTVLRINERYEDVCGWKYSWTQGLCITFRKTQWFASDYRNLNEIFPTMPSWVKNYYTNRQSLRWLKSKVRESPRYVDNADISTLNDVRREDPEKLFDPSKTTDIHQYVLDHCKFDKYNDSSLQCFHLNFYVDKEQTIMNPYREMNTSLCTINYRLDTVQLTFNDFDIFLDGQINEVVKPFKLHGYNWQLKLSYGSAAVSFITLTKELDEEKDFSNNSIGYKPAKFFANFFIKIKNQLIIDNGERPKDLIYDGSQVFTYDELTWAHNKYFKGLLPDYQGHGVTDRKREDLVYIVNGTAHWEVVVQLIELQF